MLYYFYNRFLIRLKIIIILKLLFVGSLFGQDLDNLNFNHSNKIVQFVESFVIEGQIDTSKYELGPGDKLGISIFASENISYVLTVTPTGNIWIPNIGTVYLSGLKINNARLKILSYIKENRYKTAEIKLDLLNIKHFKIQIYGAVVNPGKVVSSSVDRLADMIDKCGGLHKLADEESISILSRSGIKQLYSLKSYRIDGNLINNPIISEGDLIYVPFLLNEKLNLDSTISYKGTKVYITGFVMNPGGHKYKPGYIIDDYIAMAGGIVDYGSKKNIQVTRNGITMNYNVVEYLLPGDHINVPANLKYRLLGNMSLLQTVTAMMTLYLTYQAAIN